MALGVVTASPALLAAGEPTSQFDVLGARADVTIDIPVTTMVENVTRTDCKFASCGGNSSTPSVPPGVPPIPSPSSATPSLTPDPEKCGTSNITRPEYFTLAPAQDNVTFDEGNTSAGQPSAGGNTVPNGTAASATGCGEIGFRFTPPPGVRTFQVAFESGRAVPRTHNNAGKLPAANCVQELHVGDDNGVAVSEQQIFDPASNGANTTRLAVPVVVPPANTSANITFYFADKGTDNPIPSDSLSAASGEGALVECIGWVQHVHVLVSEQSVPFGTVLSQNQTRLKDHIEESTLVAFSTPTYPGYRVNFSLTVILSLGANASHIEAPSGERIDLSLLELSEESGTRAYTIPAALVAHYGAGTYAIALTSVRPIPLAPVAPPTSILPVTIAALVLPGVPGMLAARATLAFRRAAVGRYQTTARAFLVALGALTLLYAGALAFVLGASHLDAMAFLPLEAEAYPLFALFLLLSLGMATLWLVPSQYALVAMKKDIAERTRAEAKFRGLLETAPDAMIIVDKSGSIVLTNAQAERMFGRPRGKMVGSKVESVLPSRLRSEAGRGEKSFFDVSRAATAGDPLESVGLRADGREFPIEVMLSPIETESGTLVTAAIRDITDRKRAQSELERSNRELEHFAYVASHDLQEPLRTIAGFTQLLEQRYGEKLDEKGKSYVHRTVAGSKRMQSLINDLLAYSRIQTQGQPFSPVDLDAVVGSMLADLEAVIVSEGAQVTRDELPTVHADPSQIGQVFSNLVRNAIKYHHPARKPVIHIGAKKDGDSWLFTVRDNGIGIEREYYEKIFVIFQRLSPRTGDDSGTGLGLAITKKIVERHGGLIWVESTPGEGSTFSFSLPDRERIHHDASPPSRPTRSEQAHRDPPRGGQS